MQKIMIAGAGLLLLAGCESSMPVKSEAPLPPAKAEAVSKAEAPKTQLSEDATKALAQAEADVKEAQAKKALWTTAMDALKHAKAAAEKHNSAEVIKYAKEASEHAKLGIEQTQYPPTTIVK